MADQFKPNRPFKKPFGKPQGGKSFGRPQGDRPYSKPQGDRPYGKPSGDRPYSRPSGDRPYGKPQGDRPYSRPSGDRPYGKPQGDRPYSRPSGDHPYGKPSGDRPYSKPSGDRPYGKPQGDRPYSKPQGDRPYGKPQGDRPYSKPQGDRPYGKPQGDRPYSKPQGDRPYGKPSGDRPYSKPSGDRPSGKPQGDRPYSRPSGDRPYGKPQGDRPYSKPQGDRPYGKPQGDRSYSKPSGDRPYGKPSGDRPYGKPAFDKPRFDRPQGERTFDKPRFDRPQGERSFDKPRFDRPQGERTFDKPRFDRPQGERRPYAPKKPQLDARRAALRVLNRVLLQEGFASLSLDELFNQVDVSGADKRLCTAIVYDTLENLPKIDHALNQLLETPEGIVPEVMNLLRLSISQIMYMDRVPPSAVVNEAVNIAKELPPVDFSGLVNGVLRRFIRERDMLKWPEEGTLAYREIMTGLPGWLIERLDVAYGDEAKDIMQPRLEHATGLRLNPERMAPEAFLEVAGKKGWRVREGACPGYYWVDNVSDLGRDENYLAGDFTVQGEGAYVAALAVPLKVGDQVLDCCAAPGGKTAVLSQRLQGTGRVHAWDVHPHRLALLEETVERLRLYNVRPALRDAAILRESLESTFNAVLLDAPCTGTGLMHDKPDIKRRLKAEDIDGLTATQATMLDTVSRYVKPGGALVYATCSILPEENGEQVKKFLAKHPEFSLVSLPEEVPETFRQHQTEEGLTLLPHRDGTEGFFVAVMKRQ